jgi:hypothetical protein
MTITPTPNELLDTSIAQLRTLAAFLREQLGQGMDGMTSCSAQVGACREVLGALSVLILRLQAAREPLAGAGESDAGLPPWYDRPRASGTVFEP